MTDVVEAGDEHKRTLLEKITSKIRTHIDERKEKEEFEMERVKAAKFKARNILKPSGKLTNEGSKISGQFLTDKNPQTGKNLANILFGTKVRSVDIKKERNSLDKSSLEQALNTSSQNFRRTQTSVRSEEKVSHREPVSDTKRGLMRPKSKNPPHKLEKMDISLENSVGKNKGPKKGKLIPKVEESKFSRESSRDKNGVVAIPGKSATFQISDPRKKILRAKIVNKIDAVLNRELVEYD